MTRSTVCFALGAAALLGASNAASAVPSTVPSTFDANTAPAVSATDLINGVAGVVTGSALGGQEGTSSNVNVLTDGTFGTANLNTPAGLASTVSIASNTTITYSLNTIAFPLGYNITGINTYSGWRDSGRDNQDYSIEFSTIANPLVFNLYNTLSLVANSGGGSSLTSTDTSGLLATNVAAVRFVFGNQENGYVGYRELDVFGVGIEAIPEPTSLAALSLGGLALLRRRRTA